MGKPEGGVVRQRSREMRKEVRVLARMLGIGVERITGKWYFSNKMPGYFTPDALNYLYTRLKQEREEGK